jgi:hypothetical protein
MIKITQKFPKPKAIDNRMDVPKVKGHVTLTLTDTKTGKVETVADHNMQTDAINRFLANCGWLNRDNVDQDNLVEQLLGGVFLLDSEVDEDATVIHVPSGAKMTANGAVGQMDGGIAPSELGVYKADECDYDNTKGWLPDGAYQMIFEWDSSHGNGTIASVCATGKNYGAVGCGNALSMVRKETRIDPVNLQGTINAYSGIVGYMFGADLTDSSVYALDVTDMGTTGKGTLRKYRVPFSKVNLKGNKSTPYVISETEVTLPANMTSKPILRWQAKDGKLLVWNSNEEGNPVWGNTFTQYLWTFQTDGTYTEDTILNTSGDELYGIGYAVFDGDYILFPKAYQTYGEYGVVLWHCDTQTVYILNRTTGVTEKVDNSALGHDTYGRDYHKHDVMRGSGWMPLSGNGEGRVVFGGTYPMVVDAVGWSTAGGSVIHVAPINATDGTYSDLALTQPLTGLIRYGNTYNGNNLYVVRDQCYIATIFNLSSPVTKTADKTMKLIYRFEFEEAQQ